MIKDVTEDAAAQAEKIAAEESAKGVAEDAAKGPAEEAGKAAAKEEVVDDQPSSFAPWLGQVYKGGRLVRPPPRRVEHQGTRRGGGF